MTIYNSYCSSDSYSYNFVYVLPPRSSLSPLTKTVELTCTLKIHWKSFSSLILKKKKKTEVYAISLILKISIMLLYRYVALDYMQLFLSKTNPTSSLTKKL